MKTSISLMIVVFAFMISTVFGQSSGNSKLLNDKKFGIHLNKTKGKRSGWDWKDDEISFNANQLSSKVMSTSESFPPAACIVTIDSSSAEKIILFQATVKNPYISKIQWQGRIIGDRIDGTAIWTNGQGIQSYEFSGKLK